MKELLHPIRSHPFRAGPNRCSCCSHAAYLRCQGCQAPLCFTHVGAGLCPHCRVSYQRWATRAGLLVVALFALAALSVAVLVTLIEGSLLLGLAAAVVAIPLVSAVGAGWFRWVALWWFRHRRRGQRQRRWLEDSRLSFRRSYGS